MFGLGPSRTAGGPGTGCGRPVAPTDPDRRGRRRPRPADLGPGPLPHRLVGRVLRRHEEEEKQGEEKDQTDKSVTDGMPSFAWRGRGYAVLAAWAGLLGLLLFAAGTLASTLYLLINAASINPQTSIPGNAASLTGTFAIITFTAGGGLLAMSCLFFGAVIARSGLNLWPGIWVAFGYMALALAALFSASAAEVATAPGTGQGLLSTPAILFFALWVLWFGVMLVRLKPE